MTCAGLIFANMHDHCLPELTRLRSMASVPFGGRYRLVDFALSNMVNSGITKVGLVTHRNYQSLLDHIGTGKDWDLARRTGGIKLISPNITAFDGAAGGLRTEHRLEAILGAIEFIRRSTEDCFVLSDCDIVCNIDLRDVTESHARSGADITFVTKTIDVSRAAINEQVALIEADETGRVTDIAVCIPKKGVARLSTNLMVISRPFLLNMLADAAAHGYVSFFRDILSQTLRRALYRVYEYDGFSAYIGSLDSYFACSMALLTEEARRGLFGVGNRPVLTKVHNSAPTRYGDGARVRNALIADGCVIEGTVEDSILSRGVRVGRGAEIRHCVLMQDTYTGADVRMSYVIADKNAIIRDGRRLSGCETMPFFIGKGRSV